MQIRYSQSRNIIIMFQKCRNGTSENRKEIQMEDRIRLSYFYGKEADQFSFYKIPKLLFTEEYFKKYQWRQRCCTG